MHVKKYSFFASALTLAAALPLPAQANDWKGLSQPVPPAAAPAPAAVQPQPPAPPSAAPPAPARSTTFSLEAAPATTDPTTAGPTSDAIDETALRYYASQRDTARVAAEIRRIRLRHPDWVPPNDLFDKAPTSKVDLTDVWALFGAGRYDEVRARLDDMKRRDPTFEPPAELQQKLDVAQARVYLIQASEVKDSARVLAIARNFPAMLGCGDVDAMWRVAEALASSGDIDRAYSAYDFILVNCSNQQERLATVQKAGGVLPPAVVARLIQRGQIRIDGTTEFDPVLLDLARSEVGKSIGSSYGTGPDPAALQRVEVAARTNRSPGDVNLLGWFYYSRKEYGKAAEWFAIGADGGDAKAIEGLALTKRQSGDVEAAMRIVSDSRDRSPELSKIWVEFVSAELTSPDGGVMPDQTDLAELGDTVDAQKSALGAQSIGWWLYNQADYVGARSWFEKSAEWEASEEAVLGLGLTAKRLGDKKAVADLMEKYKGRYASLAALGDRSGVVPVSADAGPVKIVTRRAKQAKAQAAVDDDLANEAVALYQGKRYREALEVMDEIERKSGENPDLALLKGWSLYKVRDYEGAKQVFEKADTQKSTAESRRALFYADKAMRHRVYQ